MRDIDEYQEFTSSTAIYREPLGAIPERLAYCMFGLSGEVGEIAEKFKKKLRGGGSLTEFQGDDDIAKEVGDVMYYLVAMAAELGYSGSDILKLNVEKITSRQKRGTIQGDGDEH